MGSKQKTATSSSTSDPWSAQKPYLEAGFNEAQRQFNSSNPQYAPFNTVAGFSPAQQQAQAMGIKRATDGSPLLKSAQGYASDVLGGKYAQDPNQDAVFANIQQKVMPSVNSQFMNSGRYGSQMQGDTMARALTESYAPWASQNYRAGQDQMMQAAGMASGLANADYDNVNALYDIGSHQQQQGQLELSDLQNRWNYDQDLPYNKANQYMGLIGGNWGGTTTSSQPYNTPRLDSQLLGGGLSLLSLL